MQFILEAIQQFPLLVTKKSLTIRCYTPAARYEYRIQKLARDILILIWLLTMTWEGGGGECD